MLKQPVCTVTVHAALQPYTAEMGRGSGPLAPLNTSTALAGVACVTESAKSVTSWSGMRH